MVTVTDKDGCCMICLTGETAEEQNIIRTAKNLVYMQNMNSQPVCQPTKPSGIDWEKFRNGGKPAEPPLNLDEWELIISPEQTG